MASPKLSIDMIPKSVWGKNLRTLIPKDRWDNIRRAVYKNAGYMCEICGGKGDNHPVECHETWRWNKKKKIQYLTGLIALCPKCHAVKHAGRAVYIGGFDLVITHLAEVNKWSRKKAIDYFYRRCKVLAEYNKIEWQVDVSYINYADNISITKGGKIAGNKNNTRHTS